MLTSPHGDEFLGDVDMMGKEKTAPAMAALAIRYLQIAQERYGYSEARRAPTTMGIVTDNPTTMQSARPEIVRLAQLPGSGLYQPYLFQWSCFLHALSLLLTDICKLAFLKVNLDAHKLIVRKVLE